MELITLKYIELILALGETLTAKEAAQRLGVSSTSVWTKLDRLEKSIQNRLFVRNPRPRPLTLTSLGELYLEKAQAIRGFLQGKDIRPPVQMSGYQIEQLADFCIPDSGDVEQLEGDYQLWHKRGMLFASDEAETIALAQKGQY